MNKVVFREMWKFKLFLIFGLIILGIGFIWSFNLDLSFGINTDVTYENNFSHLNISDSSIVLYMPFDVNSSSLIAYDYSNYSNDGTKRVENMFDYGDKVNISLSSRYLAFPSLVRANNGDLVVAYMNSTGHVASADSTIEYKISNDNGSTWGAPAVLYNDPSFGTQTVLLVGPSLNGSLYAFVERYDSVTGARLEIYWANSADNGSTWSTFTQFDNIINETNTTYATGWDIADNGDLYLVTVNFVSTTVTSNIVWKSTDNGSTWTNISLVDSDVDSGDEADIIHTGDNNMLIVRVGTNDATTYRYISNDNGSTWGSKINIFDQVSRLTKPELFWLGDDLILSARDYNNADVAVFVSEDNGTIFNGKTLIEDYSFAPNGGYTSLAQINSTHLYMAYYTDLFSGADVRGTIISLSDNLSANDLGISQGKFQNGLNFDGIDDVLIISDDSSLDIATGLTISFWVNVGENLSSSVGNFISKGTTSGLPIPLEIDFLNSSNSIRAYQSQSGSFITSLSGGASVSRNDWHHIVFRNNGVNATLYLDGSLYLVDSSPATAADSDNEDWYVGGDPRADSKYLNGTIDELMIFDRSLTEIEVQQIYNSTYSRFYPEGEINFSSINLGTNTSINISLADCQTTNSSYFQGKVNDGSYQNFSNCSLQNYDLTGVSGLSSSNLTVKFVSNNSGFYSPLVIGNVNFSVSITSSSSGSDSESLTSSTGGVSSDLTYKISEKQLVNGYSKILKSGNKVEISRESGQVTFELKSVEDGREVSLLVDGEIYSLIGNSTLKLDTNSDGYYDLEINVDEIRFNGYVSLTFKEIYEEIPSENKEGVGDDVKVNGEKIGFWSKINTFFEKIWNWIRGIFG